jgi:hypothetical protein
MIRNNVKPLYPIRLLCGHKDRESHVICIPLNVIPAEMGIIHGTVDQGLFQSTWGPNLDAHILLPQNHEKYGIIIPATE